MTDVAAFDEFFDSCGQASERVASLDEVARLQGAPVARQHTRMVVADDFLDARRGNNDTVHTPDTTMCVVGGEGYGTFRREILGESKGSAL